MCSSYKLMGLYYIQLSARSWLVSSAALKALYCHRYWETQLGKTTLNSNGTVVAKKTVSSLFNSPDQKSFCAKQHRPRPKGLHTVAYPTGGILCVLPLRLLIIS